MLPYLSRNLTGYIDCIPLLLASFEHLIFTNLVKIDTPTYDFDWKQSSTILDATSTRHSGIKILFNLTMFSENKQLSFLDERFQYPIVMSKIRSV